jgi:hypothetical protein
VVPEEQVGAFTVNKRGSKVPAAATGGLIMTTSLWPKPCAKKYGDLVNQLSIINKVRMSCPRLVAAPALALVL